MQKKKIAGYIKAKKLVDGGMPQLEACKKSGLSRMTYHKYSRLFGDVLPNDQIEVLPQNKENLDKPTSQPKTPEVHSDLDRLIAENAALAEQLRLRQELSRLMH